LYRPNHSGLSTHISGPESPPPTPNIPTIATPAQKHPRGFESALGIFHRLKTLRAPAKIKPFSLPVSYILKACLCMPVWVNVNDFFLASPALPCPGFPVHQRNPQALPAPPAPSLQRFWPRPTVILDRAGKSPLRVSPPRTDIESLTATRLFAHASPSTPSAPLNSAATFLTACLSPIHQRQCPSQRPCPTHFLNPHHAYLLVPFWAPRAFSTWRNDLRERIPS
jgi:hypothetical protein